MKSHRAAVLSLAVLLAGLAGCTSLQSVSVTQIPSDRSRPVHAEVSDTALLGIHFDNNFIQPLTGELMRQCPQGRVTGILTKQESALYVIVQTRRIVATGFCVYDAAPSPAESSEQGEPTALREGR
jgi:hypothetical protein